MAEQIEEKPVKKLTDVAVQAAPTEAEPAPVRHYRAVLFQVLLVFIAGAFAGLTFLVKTTPSFAIDLQITKAIQLINMPSFASLMSMVSWPGFMPQAVIITAVIVRVIYAFGLHWEAVMVSVAAALPLAINLLVKNLIQRPRPTPDLVSVYASLSSYSFPSGHVMFYLGFFGFIGFLTFSLLKPSLKRGILLVVFGGMVALVGVSRIYLGEHWASDVLGSYLLGSLTLMAIIQFYLRGKTRFFVHQPAAPAKPIREPEASTQ